MRCEWEAIFQVSPGVSKPETIDDYHFFLDEEKRTCVKITYSTESYRQKLPQRSHEYEYAEETICNEHIKKIERLLLIRMIYEEEYRSMKITIFKKPFLLNREELEREGAGMDKKYVELLKGELEVVGIECSFEEALDFYSQRARLETKDDDVLKISSWLERYASAPGEVEKFRTLWTAFNSLFTVIAKLEEKSEKSEKDKIKLSIEKLVSSKEAEEIMDPFKKNGLIDKLISFNIASDRGDNFSSDLKNAAKTNKPDWVLLLKKVVLCIYGIRNPIFHDGPRVDNIEQKAAVARKLLAPVVTKCLHKMALTKIE